MRPGHPILFGVIPQPWAPNVDELEINSQDSEEARQVAFFGLPGNPMACAACLRFFVIPYLRYLHGFLPERRIPYRVWIQESLNTSTGLPVPSRELLSPPSHLDIFRLAVRSQDCECGCVRLIPAQGSHKIKPLLQAHCWVILPAHRTDFRGGAILHTLPLHAEYWLGGRPYGIGGPQTI